MKYVLRLAFRREKLVKCGKNFTGTHVILRRSGIFCFRKAVGTGNRLPDIRLRELLKSSMYGAGHTRGLAPADSAKYSVQSLSWRVVD